ncbi:hypothetical protein ASPZODRAFT_2038760 [Penicilliopsis zonata CBS 506.65]|uniref:Uncharacterized protein n=1 Tax=Penicilliopsis zonata CBS 506.65 TaxID=1073090 RepID=A0A1L9SFM3_9EURO|nr:hypothetical protein ASPZODRAFT_2038760 [Penicilliopsis zonata CBS 506.65]OJJ46040.1 hypothetical protein ASPZODRAFT_2038760 [Penicilliopsis zonata CBS 506.65]
MEYLQLSNETAMLYVPCDQVRFQLLAISLNCFNFLVDTCLPVLEWLTLIQILFFE